MNTIATAIIAGVMTTVPLSSTSTNATPPINPIKGLSICAAGIALDLSADGIETHAADTNDFEIELTLKSGSPIRVRL